MCPCYVDGSQAAVHGAVNVADIGYDFYTVTGHKLYGRPGRAPIYIRPSGNRMRLSSAAATLIRVRGPVTYATPGR